MTPQRITAAQEWEWLNNRAAHREPIDAFFARASLIISGNLPEDRAVHILELGPGPLTDLWERLLTGRGDIRYERADTRPVDASVTDLEPLWSEEQFLPYKDGAFDYILAREVFEHVFHLHRMIEECARVLRPGGRLYFSTPWMFPYHDYEDELGGDFWRLSAKGWTRLLTEAGFRTVEVTEARYLWESWQCPVTILGRAER